MIGISSFSDEKVDGNYVWFCAKSSMFTRVDEHLDWIKKHVGNDYCEL